MPATRRGELAVDVEAVMREQHHQLRAALARFFDIGAHVLLADAERPFRHHPARIGDRRIGEGLAEHGDLHAALLEHLHRLENRLVPFGVAHVEREEREAERLDQLLDARLAIGEFPMAGHGVGLQQRHAVDHVLALAAIGAERALPGIAAVEQQHLVVPRSARTRLTTVASRSSPPMRP